MFFDSLKRWLDGLEFDFVSARYTAGAISAIAVLLSWVAFLAIQPNWGIDFTGGTEIHLQFQDSIDIREVRSALRTLELSDDAVQAVNGSESGEFIVRIQDASFGMGELEDEVRTSLSKLYDEGGQSWIKNIQSSAEVSARFDVEYNGEEKTVAAIRNDFAGIEGLADAEVTRIDANKVKIEVPGLAERIKAKIQTAVGEDRPFDVLSSDSVGPKVGGELRRQGFISIAATLGLVLIYVAFRFDIGFAPGAVVALFHDVSVTVGIFVIMQLEFNLPMIGALLTIVGYSLNDTIVIYDRIRENRDRHRRTELESLINVSISETLTRTVATSATTMMAILMFLSIGGPVIRNFAFAMFLGIVFGTYSTMFVASPMILLMEDVKPWLAKMVAVVDLGDEDEGKPGFGSADDDDADQGEDETLTESEKRRRARAEADKRDPNA